MANATLSRFDHDLDAQSPAADLVRVYLNGIGKTALLNAADEVELAKRIEAGLYAQHLLARDPEAPGREPQTRSRNRARRHPRAGGRVLEADLRHIVLPWRSTCAAMACRCST